MHSFREPIVDVEFLEQGGCGTGGEYYFKNKLFTGTFFEFDDKQSTLSGITECKNGFSDGIDIQWDDQNGTVGISQFAQYSTV